MADSRAQVQRYLEGAQYPAHKHDLASTAQDNDAPLHFIKVLRGLGDERFSSPEQVVEALDRLDDPSQHQPLGE